MFIVTLRNMTARMTRDFNFLVLLYVCKCLFRRRRSVNVRRIFFRIRVFVPHPTEIASTAETRFCQKLLTK